MLNQIQFAEKVAVQFLDTVSLANADAQSRIRNQGSRKRAQIELNNKALQPGADMFLYSIRHNLFALAKATLYTGNCPLQKKPNYKPISVQKMLCDWLI